MTSGQLEGRNVLLVEDEYFQAMEAKAWLEQAGAEVVGPSAEARQIAALPEDRRIDAAVVDVNLGAGADFAVARELQRRQIPFLFLTGYDQAVLPCDFQDVRCLNKPADSRQVVRAISELVGSAGAGVL